jgi:hypothetical protein
VTKFFLRPRLGGDVVETVLAGIEDQKDHAGIGDRTWCETWAWIAHCETNLENTKRKGEGNCLSGIDDQTGIQGVLCWWGASARCGLVWCDKTDHGGIEDRA